MELDKINWYGSSGRELTTNIKNLHIVKICLIYIYKGSKISFLGGGHYVLYDGITAQHNKGNVCFWPFREICGKFYRI